MGHALTMEKLGKICIPLTFPVPPTYLPCLVNVIVNFKSKFIIQELKIEKLLSSQLFCISFSRERKCGGLRDFYFTKFKPQKFIRQKIFNLTKAAFPPEALLLLWDTGTRFFYSCMSELVLFLCPDPTTKVIDNKYYKKEAML